MENQVLVVLAVKERHKALLPCEALIYEQDFLDLEYLGECFEKVELLTKLTNLFESERITPKDNQNIILQIGNKWLPLYRNI